MWEASAAVELAGPPLEHEETEKPKWNMRYPIITKCNLREKKNKKG